MQILGPEEHTVALQGMRDELPKVPALVSRLRAWQKQAITLPIHSAC